MKLQISPMQPEDWPKVRSIYQEGIDSGEATFEQHPPEFLTWDAEHLQQGRIVARCDNKIVGWAALSPVSGRCVYAGVAEVSVYVESEIRGQGVGRELLSALIKISEDEGLWTLQAGVFPENNASLALHRSCGFRQVGRRERIGQLRGQWRDVILLERRSEDV